jgi:hypothetical protein
MKAVAAADSWFFLFLQSSPSNLTYLWTVCNLSCLSPTPWREGFCLGMTLLIMMRVMARIIRLV